MENFFSGSFGVAAVEITVDLISRVCKIAWKKKKQVRNFAYLKQTSHDTELNITVLHCISFTLWNIK